MGATRFGIDLNNLFPSNGSPSPWAGSDAGPEGNAAPAIWEGMGNVGSAIANYHPAGYDTPVQAAPPPSARPEDNAIAMPQAGAAPSAQPERAMSPDQALLMAQQKLANNEPLTQTDMLLLDDAYRQAHPGGKEGSSTTSGTSRQVAPTGPEWEANQRAQALGLEHRQGIRQDEAGHIAELGQAQDEYAQTSAHLADAHANELTQLSAKQQEANASYKTQLDKTMAEQNKAQTSYMKAAAGYDPNRLMRGGHAVTASIALALGAFGSSLTHSANSAAQIIDDQINRDIDKQKSGIAAAKDRVTWLDHVMTGNRSRFQDENAARLMTRSNAKEAYATWMDSLTAKMSGTEKVAAAKEQIAQVRMSGEQDAQNAWVLQAARLQAQAGTKSSQTTSSQSDTTTKAGDFIARLSAQADAEHKRREAYGLNGEKLNPSEQKQVVDVDKALASMADSVADVKRYQSLNEKTNPLSRAASLGDDAKSQQTVSTSLERNLAMAQNKGALSERDVEAAHDELNKGAWTAHGLNVKANELARTTGNKIAHDIMSLPASQRAERIRRLSGMVGEESAASLLSGAGLQTSAEVGSANGGR